MTTRCTMGTRSVASASAAIASVWRQPGKQVLRCWDRSIMHCLITRERSALHAFSLEWLVTNRPATSALDVKCHAATHPARGSYRPIWATSSSSSSSVAAHETMQAATCLYSKLKSVKSHTPNDHPNQLLCSAPSFSFLRLLFRILQFSFPVQ